MEKRLMKLESLKLDDLSACKLNVKSKVIEKKVVNKSKAVAIIGMSGKVGNAENLEEFWKLLVKGKEGIGSLSEDRKEDLEKLVAAKGITEKLDEDNYLKETFFKDVAGFDCSFFNIAQQEANHMDPNQRIFLETAWHALEDSGYGGKSIKGSNTGVFVGFSSDFGEEYNAF